MGSGPLGDLRVEIQLNGDPKRIDGNADILALVGSLGLDPRWVVVEHNLHAVDRSKWRETPLSEGDQVEIVRFMGGG
jgi:thiamine biosynthesis protein ThiS